MSVHCLILTYTSYSEYDFVYDKFYRTTPNTVKQRTTDQTCPRSLGFPIEPFQHDWMVELCLHIWNVYDLVQHSSYALI